MRWTLPMLKSMLAFSLVASSVGDARATLVGPGVGLTGTSVDALGGRTNVDLTATATLPAGDYIATFFHFDAGRGGDVMPFLASSNGAGSYLVLAAGSVQNPGGVALNQTVPFGGTS